MTKGKLAGKVAVVTGASKGIGARIAQELAAEGAAVVVNYASSKADADQVVDLIAKQGGKAIAVPGNVSKKADVEQLFATARKAFGPIDILVNNAGASPAMKTVLETDERLWETVMNLNLKGTYFTSQAVAKVMKDQGGGRIINIASVDGHRAEPGVSVYSISKAGVLMLTKAFAKDLAPYNILVNSIAPGPIRSKMMDSHWGHLSPEEAQKHIREAEKLTRLGRFGVPDDIAGAAIYLASEAASYTTGAEILVDGGLLL